MYRHPLVVLFILALASGCASKVEVPEPTTLPVLGPEVHRQTVSLPDGTSLRYTISIPRGYDSSKPVPLIVALHYGGDVTPFYGAGMIESLTEPAFKDLGAILIAPDSLGGDWMTAANEKAVVWLTRSVMKSYAIDKDKLLLTGFSMGGQGAWYIGGRHQDLFPVIMPVAGPLAAGPGEWKSAVYVVHSTQDEIVPFRPVKERVDQLKQKGAKMELNQVVNLTHYQTKPYARHMRESIGWLRDVWR